MSWDIEIRAQKAPEPDDGIPQRRRRISQPPTTPTREQKTGSMWPIFASATGDGSHTRNRVIQYKLVCEKFFFQTSGKQ